MKKILSIFMALAMLFCLSANLFTFAADEPVKDRSQISANGNVSKQSSTSNIINAAAIATISACGAVSSAVAGSYFYEKGYQAGRDDNWLSVGNIKAVFGTIVTYYLASKIGGGIAATIGNAIGGAAATIGNTISKAIKSTGTNLAGFLVDQGNDLIDTVETQGNNLVDAVIGQRAGITG